MSGIYFTQTKLSALGKEGKIEADKDGYYTLVVGGLEVSNNSGSWFYVKEALEDLFNPSTIFQRRLRNGAMHAEANHPRRMPGESQDAFAQRYMETDMTNVAAHFKEVWFDKDFGKNNPQYNNPNLIAIMAKLKPFGPMGKHLKEALENNAQNVCFSIRGLADEGQVRGRVIRILRDIFAIDWVNEGGITVASKWDSPACESISSGDAMRITKDLLNRIATESSCMATESSKATVGILLNRYYPTKTAKKEIYESW